MQVDKILFHSALLSFGYGDRIDQTLSVGTFSLGAGATSSAFTVTTPIDTSSQPSATVIKFSGAGNTDVNDKWLLLPGNLYFRDTTDTLAVITRTSAGLTLSVQFYNSSGASKTVPNLTITTSTYLYKPPWS